MKGLLLSHTLSQRIKSAWLWHVSFILLGLLNFVFGTVLDNIFGTTFTFFYCIPMAYGWVELFGEKYNWDKYIITLPVSRKQIILCRHIETATCEACIYLSLILSTIAAIIWRGADIAEIIYAVIIVVAATITISIYHIISAAFSVRTGQLCTVLINIVIVNAVVWSKHFFMTECAVFGTIAAIIIRAVSIPISIRLYEKKDL